MAKRYKLKDPNNPRVKRPHPDAAERITALSREGYSVAGIAARLGISPDLFLRWRDDYPEIQRALDAGREEEHHTLFNSLFKAAQTGNIVAAMFLLKTRHSYREGDQSEIANRVSINFSLPGAMSLDSFRVIEHEPTDRTEPVPAKAIAPARRA